MRGTPQESLDNLVRTRVVVQIACSSKPHCFAAETQIGILSYHQNRSMLLVFPGALQDSVALELSAILGQDQEGNNHQPEYRQRDLGRVRGERYKTQ